MKLINRIICRLKGHKWKVQYVDDYWLDDIDHYEIGFRCSRCDTTKIKIEEK